MSIDVEVLCETFGVMKEYIGQKDRQAVADHLFSILTDLDGISEKDLKVFDEQTQDSSVGHGGQGEVDKVIRNSKNLWIPTSHWIGGFLWHYVQRANRENFEIGRAHV